MTTPKKNDEIDFEVGSGNVFKDLELPEPEERLDKARIVSRIMDITTDRGLSRSEIADVLGLDQDAISDLYRGRLAAFSVDRLIKFARCLGLRVEIGVYR